MVLTTKLVNHLPNHRCNYVVYSTGQKLTECNNFLLNLLMYKLLWNVGAGFAALNELVLLQVIPNVTVLLIYKRIFNLAQTNTF